MLCCLEGLFRLLKELDCLICEAAKGVSISPNSCVFAVVVLVWNSLRIMFECSGMSIFVFFS